MEETGNKRIRQTRGRIRCQPRTPSIIWQKIIRRATEKRYDIPAGCLWSSVRRRCATARRQRNFHLLEGSGFVLWLPPLFALGGKTRSTPSANRSQFGHEVAHRIACIPTRGDAAQRCSGWHGQPRQGAKCSQPNCVGKTDHEISFASYQV